MTDPSNYEGMEPPLGVEIEETGEATTGPGSESTIDVLGLRTGTTRGWRLKRKDTELELRGISTQKLRERISAFLEGVSQSVLNAPATIGEFSLTEVTVTAEVTATGAVTLLGTGVETGGKGGITFTFTRPAPDH